MALSADHREKMTQSLINAAEQIIMSKKSSVLTAGEVAKAAGIARNSIYRYVDSVDDLRGLVLKRHIPKWLKAVEEQISMSSDPREQIVIWVEANLRQAITMGHGWMMEMGRSDSPSKVTLEVMDQSHRLMRQALAHSWMALLSDPHRARSAAAFTRGILDAGFRQLDQGIDAELVIEMAKKAAEGLVCQVVA